MNYKSLYYAVVIFVLIITATLGFNQQFEEKECELCIPSKTIDKKSPPCLQMYDAIMKYSEQYDIPRKYAFGIAYAETRYGGPFDWDYNHMQTSCAGAIGPMQIMPSTGRLMWKKRDFTNKELMSDIDFNVETSMKLLRKLHDKYGNWKIVFGCYNTGKPLINDYAERVFNHKINWDI